eukprot:6115567-Pyramimonas_sp.AAC.2
MTGAPRDEEGGEKFGHDSDEGPRVRQKDKFVAPVQYFDIAPHEMDTNERRLADETKEFRRTGMFVFEPVPAGQGFVLSSVRRFSWDIDSKCNVQCSKVYINRAGAKIGAGNVVYDVTWQRNETVERRLMDYDLVLYPNRRKRIHAA